MFDILLMMLESLVLMLSYFEVFVIFGGLCCVVLDELYVLVESKCGD